MLAERYQFAPTMPAFWSHFRFINFFPFQAKRGNGRLLNIRSTTMPSIHIRNVNETLYAKLKESSRSAHRSMSKQIQVLLANALDANSNELLRRRKLLHDMESYRHELDPKTL
jgi:hypothetical protein